MIRLFPGLALAGCLAWGCSGGAEIPPVEIGGSGGARLMNGQARSPAEAYDNAYAQLTRAHYNVRRNLESRSRNEFAAREAMAQIVRLLDTLRGCAAEAERGKFDPYAARYKGWLHDLEAGTWGGSFLADFDRTEGELKSRFSPAAVAIRSEAPLTPDRVELPKSTATPPPPEAAPPKPEPPAATPEQTGRIYFKAWDRAHDDLLAGYKSKKDCKLLYQDVVESLKLLKAQKSGDKAAKLQIYLDYYAGVEAKTKGFTALPEKTAEKDIVDELDVAARVIRKEFNPDK